MIYYTSIKNIIFEFSKYCILNCLCCDRSRNQKQHLPFSIIKNLLESNPLEYILISGCHGEPTFHPDFLEVCRIAKAQGIRIDIETNGQFHSPEWWTELGTILGEEDKVLWGLDGADAEDYSRYRINGSFNKVIDSHLAFKKNSKAKSVWKFVLFHYNIARQEEAKERSKELGFDDFLPTVEWDNEKETKSFLMHKGLTRAVDCSSIDDQDIYVDAFGFVYPCMDSRMTVIRRLGIENEDFISEEDFSKGKPIQLTTGLENEVLFILNESYGNFLSESQECNLPACNAICGKVNSRLHKILYRRLEEKNQQEKRNTQLTEGVEVKYDKL